MCGIIGILGQGDVTDQLISGLRRLEYRGYDSAGVCTMADGLFERRRAEGKLDNLTRALAAAPLRGTVGIAHTRWATHGAPTRDNAHPHIAGEVALVHNGIVENFRPLRDELVAEGCCFESQTDTEVVAHLINRELQRGATPKDAVSACLKSVQGASSFAIMCKNHEPMLIGARLGSPLVIGYGDGETYLGSDALALAPFTQKISYLEDGDWVIITHKGAEVYDRDHNPVDRPITHSGTSTAAASKGAYRHYMQKEIFEQPTVVARTLHSYLDLLDHKIVLPETKLSLAEVPRITVVACGTSFYAGMVAKYWLEQFARVPVDLDIASEFRYRQPVLEPGGLALFISQSGETADTLAALRHARAERQVIAAVVNVPTSTMAREADLLLPTHAGTEIGVASTKAFTCQLAVLAAVAAKVAREKGRLSESEERQVIIDLSRTPGAIEAALTQNSEIQKLAQVIAYARDVLYLGRGLDYPIALEGALKLKEISYIHAEGYAAGEMKHGPIALIDQDVPVVVIAPSGPLFEKTVSNMEEVQARGGKVVLISDAKGLAQAGEGAVGTIEMPEVHRLNAPLVYAVPMQLIAYHVALIKGTDVDQPRNLAKSVTVE